MGRRGRRSSISSGRTSGSTSSPARRTSRSGRSCLQAPERSSGFLDYFFAPDADPGWLDELLAFDRQVAEDRVLVERVEKGCGRASSRRDGCSARASSSWCASRSS
jgi:hypothetical protein